MIETKEKRKRIRYFVIAYDSRTLRTCMKGISAGASIYNKIYFWHSCVFRKTEIINCITPIFYILNSYPIMFYLFLCLRHALLWRTIVIRLTVFSIHLTWEGFIVTRGDKWFPSGKSPTGLSTPKEAYKLLAYRKSWYRSANVHSCKHQPQNRHATCGFVDVPNHENRELVRTKKSDCLCFNIVWIPCP